MIERKVLVIVDSLREVVKGCIVNDFVFKLMIIRCNEVLFIGELRDKNG